MLFSVKQAFVGRDEIWAPLKNAYVQGYLRKGQAEFFNPMCLPIFRGKRIVLQLNPVLIFIEFHPTQRAWKRKGSISIGKYGQLLITQTF